MELKTNRNSHAMYSLEYHLILVTKYRRPCITEDVYNTLVEQICKVAQLNGIEMEEASYEADHMHMLLSAPPQINLAQVINSMKTTSSRAARKKHGPQLQKYFRKPVFWSRSYLILSSGGAPIDVIKRYIREQGTPEHAAKAARKKGG